MPELRVEGAIFKTVIEAIDIVDTLSLGWRAVKPK
jgi:hypothetical protein